MWSYYLSSSCSPTCLGLVLFACSLCVHYIHSLAGSDKGIESIVSVNAFYHHNSKTYENTMQGIIIIKKVKLKVPAKEEK